MPIHAPFLKYFMEVARCGSVRLAASRLFISSSAVNRQILKIEDELGTRLFDRSASGMELTAAGHLLLAHVERTLQDAEHTLTEILALESSEDRPIIIAGQESVIGEFLSPVLLQFHSTCTNSCSAFKASGGNELSRLLHDTKADIAVAFDAPSEPDIESACQQKLSVGAIVSPQHPLASKSTVSLLECTEYPLILPDASWPLRRLLDSMIIQLDKQPTVISTSNSVEFLRSMVDQQLGIGFQTAMGIEPSLNSGLLVKVPLCNPEPVQQVLSICISRTASRPASFETLLSLLNERVASYAKRWC